MQQNKEEENRQKDAAPTTLLASQVCKNPHRLFWKPERQEKLEDYRKRMLFPRRLVWPSNREPLSDTTFNHILVFSHVQYTQLKVIIGSSHLISMKTMSTAWRGFSFKHKSCLSWKWMAVLFSHKYVCKCLSWRTWRDYLFAYYKGTGPQTFY